MLISEWFLVWLREHLARHAFMRFPDPASEDGRLFFAAWKSTFHRKGIDVDLATEASIRLAGENVYRSKHFNRLIELVGEIRLERGINATVADSSTREGAAQASRGCPHCQGEGIAVVRWLNPREHISEGTCATYCLCSMGHWLRRQHEHNAKDIYKRMPLLVDVLNGRYPQFEAFGEPVPA